MTQARTDPIDAPSGWSLPATRHAHRGYTSLAEPERERLSRRNFYRIIDRFGARRDLLLESAAPAGEAARTSRHGSPHESAR